MGDAPAHRFIRPVGRVIGRFLEKVPATLNDMIRTVINRTLRLATERGEAGPVHAAVAMNVGRGSQRTVVSSRQRIMQDTRSTVIVDTETRHDDEGEAQ